MRSKRQPRIFRLIMKTVPVSSYAFDSRPSTPALVELDRVATLEPVKLDREVTLPAGSQGTIVGIWGGGAAFEVEFTDPVEALVTLTRQQVRHAEPV